MPASLRLASRSLRRLFSFLSTSASVAVAFAGERLIVFIRNLASLGGLRSNPLNNITKVPLPSLDYAEPVIRFQGRWEVGPLAGCGKVRLPSPVSWLERPVTYFVRREAGWGPGGRLRVRSAVMRLVPQPLSMKVPVGSKLCSIRLMPRNRRKRRLFSSSSQKARSPRTE